MEGKAPLLILGETAYPPAVASARVRLANFAPYLAAEGVNLRYQPTLTDGGYATLASDASVASKAMVLAASALRAVRRSPGHDLLLVHRLRLLSPLPGIDPPRRLDAYDIDDALFLGSVAAVNHRFQWAKQEARRCIDCLRRARLVITGNAYLADRALEYARRVEVVPTCVDPSRQELHKHEEQGPLTVGWIGSQTTSEYLKPLAPVFEQLNSTHLRAKLVVVGAQTGIRAHWIEHRPWLLAQETSELAAFDIGIMPLPDTDWARGKCGYKVLQYFSAGVPAVASPVGVTPGLVGAERGLLATTTGEWYAALDRLIDDVSERRQRGAAGRAFVEQHYSYQRWAPELAGMLRSLAG